MAQSSLQGFFRDLSIHAWDDAESHFAFYENPSSGTIVSAHELDCGAEGFDDATA